MTEITEPEAPPENHIVTRGQLCGCGTTFQQRAIKTSLMPSPLGWSPLRCLACQTELRAAQQRQATELRAEEAGERRRRALKDLAVPPLYVDVSLATFQAHGPADAQEKLLRIKELACLYVAGWPIVPESQELLLFMGACGSGKGHIAWSIARALAAGRAAHVRVVKLAAIIRDLREPWRGPEGPSEDARLERYRELDLLVIDEVSRHAFYGKQISQHLYDIIDDRGEQHRPTILTTNESQEGVGEILGGALMSRLNGAGGVIQFPDVDWRSRVRGE